MPKCIVIRDTYLCHLLFADSVPKIYAKLHFVKISYLQKLRKDTYFLADMQEFMRI